MSSFIPPLSDTYKAVVSRLSLKSSLKKFKSDDQVIKLFIYIIGSRIPIQNCVSKEFYKKYRQQYNCWRLFQKKLSGEILDENEESNLAKYIGSESILTTVIPAQEKMQERMIIEKSNSYFASSFPRQSFLIHLMHFNKTNFYSEENIERFRLGIDLENRLLSAMQQIYSFFDETLPTTSPTPFNNKECITAAFIRYPVLLYEGQLIYRDQCTKWWIKGNQIRVKKWKTLKSFLPIYTFLEQTTKTKSKKKEKTNSLNQEVKPPFPINTALSLRECIADLRLQFILSQYGITKTVIKNQLREELENKKAGELLGISLCYWSVYDTAFRALPYGSPEGISHPFAITLKIFSHLVHTYNVDPDNKDDLLQIILNRHKIVSRYSQRTDPTADYTDACKVLEERNQYIALEKRKSYYTTCFKEAKACIHHFKIQERHHFYFLLSLLFGAPKRSSSFFLNWLGKPADFNDPNILFLHRRFSLWDPRRIPFLKAYCETLKITPTYEDKVTILLAITPSINKRFAPLPTTLPNTIVSKYIKAMRTLSLIAINSKKIINLLNTEQQITLFFSFLARYRPTDDSIQILADQKECKSLLFEHFYIPDHIDCHRIWFQLLKQISNFKDILPLIRNIIKAIESIRAKQEELFIHEFSEFLPTPEGNTTLWDQLKHILEFYDVPDEIVLYIHILLQFNAMPPFNPQTITEKIPVKEISSAKVIYTNPKKQKGIITACVKKDWPFGSIGEWTPFDMMDKNPTFVGLYCNFKEMTMKTFHVTFSEQTPLFTQEQFISFCLTLYSTSLNVLNESFNPTAGTLSITEKDADPAITKKYADLAQEFASQLRIANRTCYFDWLTNNNKRIYTSTSPPSQVIAAEGSLYSLTRESKGSPRKRLKKKRGKIYPKRSLVPEEYLSLETEKFYSDTELLKFITKIKKAIQAEKSQELFPIFLDDNNAENPPMLNLQVHSEREHSEKKEQKTEESKAIITGAPVTLSFIYKGKHFYKTFYYSTNPKSPFDWDTLLRFQFLSLKADFYSWLVYTQTITKTSRLESKS